MGIYDWHCFYVRQGTKLKFLRSCQSTPRPEPEFPCGQMAQKVLNRLGLGKELASIGGLIDRVAYYSNTGKNSPILVAALVDQVGQRPYPRLY